MGQRLQISHLFNFLVVFLLQLSFISSLVTIPFLTHTKNSPTLIDYFLKPYNIWLFHKTIHLCIGYVVTRSRWAQCCPAVL